MKEELIENFTLAETFFEHLPEKALQLGWRVVVALATLLIGIWIIKLTKRLIKKAFKRSRVEVGIAQFLVSLIGATLYVLLAFMIAGTFGMDAASILAVLGSAGVAIGLAVQGSLSNLAGGILILLTKPFKVGDYIKEDNKGNEGTVAEISLFYTKLQTLDERTVILPNGSLANTSLTNCTATPHRLLEFSFEIAYDADLKKACELIKEEMKKTEMTVRERGYEVYVNSLLADGVELGARCYVENKNIRYAKQEINERVKLRFDEEGIEIPYPQLTVRMKNE